MRDSPSIHNTQGMLDAFINTTKGIYNSALISRTYAVPQLCVFWCLCLGWPLPIARLPLETHSLRKIKSHLPGWPFQTTFAWDELSFFEVSIALLYHFGEKYYLNNYVLTLFGVCEVE